ncbi:hypothetical protein DIPPA_18066 [Diplonema papillatum]|nr:hypothetical protein DIPPA_18066 [Diplonema papillatum]
MYEEAPEGFLTVVEKFRVSGHSSLLELVVIEGREGMPTAVPVRFRTAAKKWGACHADREKEAAKEEDKRRARKPGEAREELAVRELMLRFGLASLPEVPPRATLNAYQAAVEANPELALPYVDVSRPPYTPRMPDWKVDGGLDAVQRVLTLQRFVVVASLAGCFGSRPWPVVLGYPAVVAGIAAMYGEGMAAEYDERLRKLFAEEPKAEEGAELHQAAEKKLVEAYPGILNELFWRGTGARATSGAGHRGPGRRERGEVSARSAPLAPALSPQEQAQLRNRTGRRERGDEGGRAKKAKPND